jgi:hypothetical protein
MTAVQPSLPADFPEPEPSDYDTWASECRPAFVAAARAGQPFVCWKVARDAKLPNPPDQKRDWARFIGELHHDNVIRLNGFGLARDKSCVRRWIGTTAAREGRVA